jgi:hypothetical protein
MLSFEAGFGDPGTARWMAAYARPRLRPFLQSQTDFCKNGGIVYRRERMSALPEETYDALFSSIATAGIGR